MKEHEIDLGFIMNPRFARTIRTIPLFEENLFFVCSQSAEYEAPLSPNALDVSDEIYIPLGQYFSELA